MPSALPDGDPAPGDGRLPDSALDRLDGSDWGVYVHVPFCSVRCGYCDFTTYTVPELGGRDALDGYPGLVERELDLARAVLPPAMGPVATVFLGGGTPTMLAPAALGQILRAVDERFGLAPGAEVTTEANPDSVTARSLQELAAAGFTRVSLGMQSAVPRVLATLERTHDPRNVAAAVAGARAAGLGVSLDLIYGTPGESHSDWEQSLDAALALEPDHVSAYALVVEEGTRLAAAVRRGLVAAPEDDDEADKYELADSRLTAVGLAWYEVSNWAKSPAHRCRHNEGYWAGASWWGIGPGAHSHVGGVRWWNVKHPRAYGDRLAAGVSPAAGRETLTSEQAYDEWVLLGIRRSQGLPIDGLRPGGRIAVAGLVADGLLDAEALGAGRAALTRRGRLLADAVVRRLVAPS
ncbi:MAG TPA: radical SAM family heme chaperone HemW [Candidatus Lustribacter sp.]|nr:radical SAM family heme chaperone HemW [Candidatus Lustribacter sp.]